MKTKYFLFFFFVSFCKIVRAQDKNAEAIVHYTKAEEYYNQGTLLGAENCLDELRRAEDALGTTNSKILYLKIMAASKFNDYYYAYENILWLKDFFKITDANTFPSDKYANIINSGYLDHLVKDTAFQTKIRSDSSFVKEYYKWAVDYQFTSEAEYDHAMQFYNEAYHSMKPDDPDLWRNEEFQKAYFGLELAANMEHKKGLLETGKEYNVISSYDEDKTIYYGRKALYQLSVMYEFGYGTLKDYKQSLNYAIQAYDTSRIALLYMLDEGQNIINNGDTVIEWCSAVYNQSQDSLAVKFAATAIGKIYDKGVGGTTKDNYQAMEWYIKASQKGCNYCYAYMDRIVYRSSQEDDKKTRKAIEELYNSYNKSKRK